MKSGKHGQAEEIIFGKEVEYEWNIKRFKQEDSVTTEDVSELMDIEFLDPEDRQNESPTAKELLELGQELDEELEEDTEVKYIGYIRSPEDDTPSRMTLTGFTISGEITEEVREEVRLLNADEKEVSGDYVRLWWD